jgi:hypothetical protein
VSKPLLLQNSFTAGMKRDFPRNRMPADSAWTLKDVILEYGAPARERGGWTHTSPNIAGVPPFPATWITAGIYAVFSTASGSVPRNICIDDAAQVYEFTSGVSASNVGFGWSMIQNPVFHGGARANGTTVNSGLVIIPDGGAGNQPPKKYNGTAITLLNGSPPAAKYAAIYKDYTVLGNGYVSTVQYPNRIWFSPVGDPDCSGSSGASAWDTTDSWIDFTTPVRGLAATKNALLVFGDGNISRVRGSIAPPDTDMTVDDPWQKLGLVDPFSITVHEDIVYWCAPEGVFRSDGVYLDNITGKGGMLRYWLDLMAGADDQDMVATGVIRNKLVISILDGAGGRAPIAAFMVDLQTYAWTEVTNLDARSFWDGVRDNTINDDLFFGRSQAAYVARLETVFSEVDDANYKNDGDGVAVASIVETPFYEMGRPGLKTVKGLHAGYQLTDHATDNPTVAVSYITSPEQTTYTALGTLSETTDYDRKRLQLGGRYYGLGFKFARQNAGDFLGYDLSAEVGFQEESKRKT